MTKQQTVGTLKKGQLVDLGTGIVRLTADALLTHKGYMLVRFEVVSGRAFDSAINKHKTATVAVVQ
jgi:hypothetical protein